MDIIKKDEALSMIKTSKQVIRIINNSIMDACLNGKRIAIIDKCDEKNLFDSGYGAYSQMLEEAGYQVVVFPLKIEIHITEIDEIMIK